MKGLAIDCAVSRLTIAAKNDDYKFISVYDIGMKQSETIVPAIDLAINKAGLNKTDLEYLAITAGPGSFTGLRLAISALKAIEMAFNIPLYGISSLDAYSYAYKNFSIPVLSVIDANKNKYYAAIYENQEKVLEDNDYDISFIKENIKTYEELLICGPDANKLKEIIIEDNKNIKISTLVFEPNAVESLFEIAEYKILNKESPLKDFDGPIYLRASEAEIKLQGNQ